MPNKSIRADFSEPTKEIIAKRAGYKCSFPGCNKTLVGPGVKNDEWITIGECAHIFSAAPTGPRTSGGLSYNELSRPENGVFLCKAHHKIIDSKSESSKYTSDLLIRYKNAHEFQISAELGEYMYPLNYISNVKVKKGSIFNSPININLGKVTFFYGNNGTGKSTIIELLYSFFNQTIFSRWDRPNCEFIVEISTDNPVLKNFDAIIRDNQLSYQVGKESQPFVPYDFFVIFLNKKIIRNKDDLKTISECFGWDRKFVKSMLTTTAIKHGLRTKEIEIIHKREKPYQVDELNVNLFDSEPHSFKSCSDTEKANVILDIAISFATEISKFKSVLLLIDWESILSFDDSNLKLYLDYLSSSEAHFQSIFVSPNERKSLDWSGWMIAKFEGSVKSSIKVVQNEK